MSLARKNLKALPDTTLRRLRNTPSYFFLIWRWSTWLYALIVILTAEQKYRASPVYNTCLYLLLIALLQPLVVTLYAPVLQIVMPRIGTPKLRHNIRQKAERAPAEGEEPEIVPPLVRTRNPYWDIAIYGMDVLICGLIMYYSGPFGGQPNFGVGSPFYRYGISTAFAAACAYRYRGGLAAAIGYDLFVVLGVLLPAPGGPHYTANSIDILGSLVDTPLAAILAAYLVSLLANISSSKKQVQMDGRRQKALRAIGEIILRYANDKPILLQKSAEAIRSGGHFQRLVLALVNSPTSEEQEDGEGQAASATTPALLEIETCVNVDISVPEPKMPERDEALLKQVLESGEKLVNFAPLQGTADAQEWYARLYMPFFKNGRVQMILGAENLRHTPFESKQEEFLSIAGTQLLIALDNIRLTEQTVQLAATAERTRIAREIHDGIAQVVYMLSLNAETCATQAHRIVEASEEDAELVTPLAERLDRLVTVSKQALWETRNYMFSLKPLMSGTTTLTQMIASQLREFEAISDLPVHLEVQGSEKPRDDNSKLTRRQAQVGAAIFRIVQEALTNAYKHADASQLWVYLTYTSEEVDVRVRDDGRGLQAAYYSYDLSMKGDRQRIYSGHGMRGMRDRAEELGGTFELIEIPEGGVSIHARIPI
ncbi:MAG TPA: ATP-binding protein [Ktedonobacteraceae bacterium]|nr:ATP-binding protein [Ktedonobacteraceae bacterium]